MAPHAGFAAAIVIGQSPMQRLLRALYVANKITHVFDLNHPLLTGRLFVDVPQLTFAAGTDNRFRLDIRCWGVLEALPGPAAVSRTVQIDATVDVPPLLAIVESGQDLDQDGLNDTSLSFGIDGANASVRSVHLTVLDGGGSFPPVIQAVLDGPAFATEFEQALRNELGGQASASMPLTFLGGLAVAPRKTVTGVVLDGAFAIGIDVSFSQAGSPIVLVFPVSPVDSSGDPAALTDFREGADIAYWIHAAQVPMLVGSAVQRATANLPEGSVLDRLTIRAIEGAIHFAGEGHATDGTGSATFRFDLVPRLSNERYLKYKETLSFVQRHLHVDVHQAGWVTALQVFFGIFSFGIVSLAVAAIVDMFRSNLVHQLATPSTTAGARNQQFTLPGTRKPVLDLRIERYEIHHDGIFSAMGLRPRLPKTRLTGASRLYSDRGRAHVQVYYAVTLREDLLDSDPQLRVAWTLRRLDRNEAIDATNGPAKGHRNYRADVVFDAAVVPAVSLECRVFRVLGAATHNLFNKSVRLAAVDDLDPSHPFVRWHANVALPAFTVEADGSVTKTGIPFVERYSRIHRTDLAGRCLFAARTSSFAAGREYLDALPFPASEILFNRRHVCDYCFFGGPDKRTPLV
jgi:hypothetical protein